MTLLNSREGAARDTREIPPRQFCSAHGSMETCITDKDSSRRQFMQKTMGGALAGLITAAGMEFATSRPVPAQSKLSPDAALQELMDGNRRFTSGRLTAFHEGPGILKQNTIEKQEPFAAVLSCADSRVPVELVFDQSIGHNFVYAGCRQFCHPRDYRES